MYILCFKDNLYFFLKKKSNISSPPKTQKQSQTLAQLPQPTNNTITTTTMMNVSKSQILGNHEKIK